MCTGHGKFLASTLVDDVAFCKEVKAVTLVKSAPEWHAHALVHFIQQLSEGRKVTFTTDLGVRKVLSLPPGRCESTEPKL